MNGRMFAKGGRNLSGLYGRIIVNRSSLLQPQSEFKIIRALCKIRVKKKEYWMRHSYYCIIITLRISYISRLSAGLHPLIFSYLCVFVFVL